jgi:hypothetical protein
MQSMHADLWPLYVAGLLRFHNSLEQVIELGFTISMFVYFELTFTLVQNRLTPGKSLN